MIAEHGGKQISATQVAWMDGAVVLDVATPGIGLAALEGCADNAYCFYQHQNFGGRKLTSVTAQQRACGRTSTTTGSRTRPPRGW